MKEETKDYIKARLWNLWFFNLVTISLMFVIVGKIGNYLSGDKLFFWVTWIFILLGIFINMARYWGEHTKELLELKKEKNKKWFDRRTKKQQGGK